MSCVSSFMLCDTLVSHSSVFAKNVACSKFMYIIVLVIDLCPKMYLTCMMSLVLWYSVVPFQCLKVWNDIFLSSWFPVNSTMRFLWIVNWVLIPSLSLLKMFSLVLLNVFSIAISLSDIGTIRGLLPFSGVILIVFLSKFRSFHLRSVSSPILIPVSFRHCKAVAVFLPLLFISSSILFSVGIYGVRSSFL